MPANTIVSITKELSEEVAKRRKNFDENEKSFTPTQQRKITTTFVSLTDSIKNFQEKETTLIGRTSPNRRSAELNSLKISFNKATKSPISKLNAAMYDVKV